MEYYGIMMFTYCMILKAVDSSGKFHLKMISYRNPTDKLSNNHCCDNTLFLHCTSPCDPYFEFCFQHSVHSGKCELGKTHTRSFDDVSSIIFTRNMQGVPNPLNIPIRTWKGSMYVSIKAVDQDQLLTEKIATLGKTFTLIPGGAAVKATLVGKTVTLVISARVTCDRYYYGADCSTLCKPPTLLGGHYRCSANGTRICQKGWKGVQCSTIAVSCKPSSCTPHGTCIVNQNAVKCICHRGFTGKRCQTNIDNCVNVICQNHGTCVDGIHSYQCSCTNGYYGTHCETPINRCLPNPCHNRAACTSANGLYHCSCLATFTGQMCETKIHLSSRGVTPSTTGIEISSSAPGKMSTSAKAQTVIQKIFSSVSSAAVYKSTRQHGTKTKISTTMSPKTQKARTRLSYASTVSTSRKVHITHVGISFKPTSNVHINGRSSPTVAISGSFEASVSTVHHRTGTVIRQQTMVTGSPQTGPATGLIGGSAAGAVALIVALVIIAIVLRKRRGISTTDGSLVYDSSITFSALENSSTYNTAGFSNELYQEMQDKN